MAFKKDSEQHWRMDGQNIAHYNPLIAQNWKSIAWGTVAH